MISYIKILLHASFSELKFEIRTFWFSRHDDHVHVGSFPEENPPDHSNNTFAPF